MEVISHKCPNCGGALTFNPDDQKFHCPFCLSVFTEKEVLEFEEKEKASHVDDPLESTSSSEQEATADVENADTETEAEQNLDLFLCPNCGAEIVTDSTTAATFCYFCHNPVVLSGRLSGDFQPEKVLPFAISKEKAVESFLAWTKKKWFIPSDFFDKKQIQLLTGVYFPYWNVEAKVKGQFQGTGTTLRVWRVGEIEYTETKQFAVSRAGKLSFSNLVKNALSKNTQKKMVASVQPFPLEKAVDFHTQYLSGFQGEKRDIEYLDLKPEVEKELAGYTKTMLKQTAPGYTTLQETNLSSEVTEEKNHYVLLPVWLVTYQNKGDKTVYYYAMNGQTGKTAGILPISFKKLALFSGGIFLGLLALLLLGGYLL